MSCLVAHEEKEGWHRMRIWMKKYTKRFLCQKFFLFLLIALPFFTYLYSYAVHQKSTKVKVGIVADKDNVFVREIQEELLSKTGMITFCEISSEKDMIQKIRKGDLTCGYVFPDTLKKQYENGQYEKCIKQYHSEGNAFFLIAREAVISSVFRVYGRQMLEDYIAQSGLFESHEIEKGEISQKYKDNLAKQQTFTMEINKQNFAKKQMGDYLLAPLHGGVAFLILLARILWAYSLSKRLWETDSFCSYWKMAQRDVAFFDCGAGGSDDNIRNFVRAFMRSFVFNNKRNCFSTDL